jgi:transposase
MKILAIDLGKRKSTFCEYDTAGGEAGVAYGKLDTNRQAVEAILLRLRPDRLVIEAGAASGWVCDVARGLSIPVQVANVNDPSWHWKRVKNKSDRTDGLKMAQMSHLDCLPTVHVPHPRTRQWRSLIEYRAALVSRRTAVKNSIRAIYDRRGCSLSGGDHVWTKAGLADLAKDARPAAQAWADDLWRLQLYCELRELEGVQRQIDEVEKGLANEATDRPEVKLLRTAPMVGPRLAETVAAVLDDPHRFKNGREVGAYAGLTPRQWDSGESVHREGHISRQGHALLRALLVEVSWLGVRTVPWMTKVYEGVRRGSEKRKKVAIVAVARRLLVRLWAMWRDGAQWRDPEPAAATLAGG